MVIFHSCVKVYQRVTTKTEQTIHKNGSIMGNVMRISHHIIIIRLEITHLPICSEYVMRIPCDIMGYQNGLWKVATGR